MNINNPDNISLPDVEELQKLANQFFKALPGDYSKTGFPPAALSVENVDANLFQQDQSALLQPPLTNNLDIPKFSLLENKPPKSVAGAGISPSAINQGNVMNPQNEQTSLPDANFDPIKIPSSLGGSGISPSVPGNTTELNASPVNLNQATEHKQVDDFTKRSLQALPYQQEQPYEAELREALSGMRSFLNVPQLPGEFSSFDAPSFYFMPGKDVMPPVNEIPAYETEVLPSRGQISGLSHQPYDVNLARRDFPILKERVNGRPLIWLDNAATTQKPQQVIDRLKYYYEHENSNIHRAAHELAARATDAFENARKKVQLFLNANSTNEIVFVRGATEAINLVAQSWGEQNLKEGDEILITHIEHHANIVPWQMLAKKKGLKLKVAPVDDDGQVLLGEYGKLLGAKTKLVAFAQVSNALGTVTPAKKMIEMAHAIGAKVLLDGAQAVSHMRADVQYLDADWYVFSGHKVFAPTGIGVLYGKEDLLNETQPWQGGGNMITDVTFEESKFQSAPGRFEAGTGNIGDAIGLGAAIDYVSRIGMEAIHQYENYLLQYATRLLKEIPGLRIIGTAPDKAGVISFVMAGYKTEEIGTALNKEGIAVRAGHHCAQPILRRFGVESTVRPSLALYNTCEDIDALIAALHRLRGFKRPDL